MNDGKKRDPRVTDSDQIKSAIISFWVTQLLDAGELKDMPATKKWASTGSVGTRGNQISEDPGCPMPREFPPWEALEEWWRFLRSIAPTKPPVELEAGQA